METNIKKKKLKNIAFGDLNVCDDLDNALNPELTSLYESAQEVIEDINKLIDEYCFALGNIIEN